MYILAVFICVAVSVVSVVDGQFLNCNWVNSLDCKHFTPGPICGTDGVTYENRCFIAKAQCVDRSLRTVADGKCPEKAPTTQSIPQTTTPTTPVTTTVPVTQISSDPLHTMCDTMSHVHCTNDIEPLCGSDDSTYINTCEFHKKVCVHHGLTVKHVGFC